MMKKYWDWNSNAEILFPETLQEAAALGNVYALIPGRHEYPIPVDGYAFPEIENVFDFRHMQQKADNFLLSVPLCNAALMFSCSIHKADLVLWHYDRETGEYCPQYFPFSDAELQQAYHMMIAPESVPLFEEVD